MDSRLTDKILITGSTGFVGYHLCQHLREENLAFSILNLRDKSWRDFSKDSNETIASIVHLAGVNEGASDDTTYHSVNYLLSKELFDAFVESSAELFIYISSIKALSNEELINVPLTEEMESGDLSAYGKSKRDAEKYILSAELPPNKRVLILRPCMIYGPGNLGNLNRLIKLVSYRIPYPLGGIQNQRSILYVENLCKIITTLHLKKIPSGIYHVADDGYYSTDELLDMIANTLGKSPIRWNFSQKYLTFIARIGSALHLPFNSNTLHKLSKNYRLDTSKLMTQLQIKLPYSSKEGIKKTVLNHKK